MIIVKHLQMNQILILNNYFQSWDAVKQINQTKSRNIPNKSNVEYKGNSPNVTFCELIPLAFLYR